MDNTNNTLSSGQNTFLSSGQTISSTTSNESGFFDGFKNINITTWLLIILILAFLGFNIFAYLAKGTQEITNIFDPLIKAIFGTTVAVTGKVVDVSAEGAKNVVSGTADVLESGLTAIQNITPQDAKSSIKSQPVNQTQQPPDVMQQTSLNKALNNAQQTQGSEQDYQANEASTSVHSSSGKAGWCYVGVDRGFRTCAEVGANDTCMSGDIFPSQEICMNPNLRP